MTLLKAYRCNICGKLATAPYDDDKSPLEGWFVAQICWAPGSIQDLDVCPECAKAIREGKDPVHEHTLVSVTGGTPIYSVPKVEVVPLRYTATEEEA